MNRPNKGFTLMELLIVIGVLGILAAGLLAAIDPFEQLKKARDTNNRSATIEMLSSLTRYYANHGAFPWNVTTPITACSRASGGGLAGFDTIALSAKTANVLETCLTATLIADGELKSTYFTGIGNTTIYVGSSATDNTNLEVCFLPEGKASRSDPSTKYLVSTAGSPSTITIKPQTAGSGALCPSATEANCAQCFK